MSRNRSNSSSDDPGRKEAFAHLPACEADVERTVFAFRNP
jgi:hypothetical protein